MNLSLEQLQAFRAAAETGSFSAAARRLGKAQSVISTAVSNLEIDLGLDLFDRRGRYPQLTAAGERLLAEARLILERCDHLRGIAGNLAEGVETRLAIAVDGLFDEQYLGDVLQNFAERFPSVELELMLPLMEDVSDLVLQRRVDLGVIMEQQNPPVELGFRMLGQVELLAVAAPEHPLHRLTAVPAEELKRFRQLVASPRGASQERTRFRWSAEVWWVENHWVIMDLVRRNLGWALLPQHMVQDDLHQGTLKALQLEFGENLMQIGLELVWHKHHPLGKAAQWLKQQLAQPG